MDRCDECGFVYGDHGPGVVAAELASLGARFGERLQVPPAEARRYGLLRRRPEPDVWSALEYACHVRDVLIAQRERLFLALVEDCPSFAPIYRDQRAVLARYATEEPERVAAQLDLVADMAARSFAGIDASGWARGCMYNFPTPTRRSVAWLAQHRLHEGEHHLFDVDRVTARALGS